MRRVSVLLVMIIFRCGLSYGQTAPVNSEFDRKYAPNQTSIFNHQQQRTAESIGLFEIKNSIQFSVTMLIRQKFFFLYERNFSKGLCLNAGLGKAFGTDYIQAGYYELFRSTSVDNEASVGKLIENASYQSSLPLISVGVKKYFSHDNFDGTYIGFSYRFERTTYLLKSSIYGINVQGARDLVFKMHAMLLSIGYTSITGRRNNVSHDFSMSFGARYIAYTEYNIINPLKSGSAADKAYRKSGADVGSWIPSMNLTYIFGFKF